MGKPGGQAGRRARAPTSWYTGAEEESRGLTVFLFLISGSFSTPPLASCGAARAVPVAIGSEHW